MAAERRAAAEGRVGCALAVDADGAQVRQMFPDLSFESEMNVLFIDS